MPGGGGGSGIMYKPTATRAHSDVGLNSGACLFLCLCAVLLFLRTRSAEDQLGSIFSALAPDIQVCANSETGEPASDISKLLRMRNQVVLRMVRDPVTLADIRQFYLDVDAEENKLDALRELAENLPVTHAVVYCNTRRKLDFLLQHNTIAALQLRGYALLSACADLDSQEREAVLRSFSSTSKAVLLCTDSLGSALHSLPLPPQGATRAIFINFDLPTGPGGLPATCGMCEEPWSGHQLRNPSHHARHEGNRGLLRDNGRGAAGEHCRTSLSPDMDFISLVSVYGRGCTA